MIPGKWLGLRGGLHVESFLSLLKRLRVHSLRSLRLNHWVWWMLWDRTESAAIAHVQDVNILIHDQDYNCTRACLVVGLVRWRTDQLQVVFFGLEWACSNGLRYVWREFWLQYYVVVQIVFQVLCAPATSMSIINTKDLKLRPFICRDAWCLLCRLNHVQDDRDSVFIGLAYYTNVGIRSKCSDHTERLGADLTRLEEWQSCRGLILLQKLRNRRFDMFRGQLRLSALPWSATLGLLGLRHCLHNDSESSSLPHVLHEAGRRVRLFKLRLGGLRWWSQPLVQNVLHLRGSTALVMVRMVLGWCCTVLLGCYVLWATTISWHDFGVVATRLELWLARVHRILFSTWEVRLCVRLRRRTDSRRSSAAYFHRLGLL